MYFHVLLTMECDLNCKFCFSDSINDIDSDFNFKIDYSLPREINYNVKLLADFCEKDPDCVLSFYGGEPTPMHAESERDHGKSEGKVLSYSDKCSASRRD